MRGFAVAGLNPFPTPPPGAVVALGMFDGVHVGHQQLIRTAMRLAARQGGTSVVITFDPDPQQVLDPRHARPPLMTLESRVRTILALGVQIVWIIPFTSRFSKTSPEEFVETILARRLRATAVVVGETFAFGAGRRGNLATLRGFGERRGFRVIALPAVRCEGAAVSSSRIRRLIEQGQLAQAKRLLGRPLQLSGVVVRGDGRATRLGFPTANVRLAPQLLPPRGVYSVELRWGSRSRKGLMNLGVRPTFGAGPLTCEVHLPGFRGSLYGKPVTISMHRFVRPEQRFSSSEQLTRQVRRDLARTHAFLSAPASA